jgi:serine phosphatase RsbU (regulator of sigma subunit)/putative methionine-R-sulfoxide reductase with GAF domain
MTLWLGLCALVVAWPLLGRTLSRRAADQKTAEIRNVFVDAALGGGVAALLSFALWPSFALTLPTWMSNIRNAGVKVGVATALASVAAALATAAVTGLHFRGDAGPAATALGMVYMTAFLVYYTVVTRTSGRTLRQRTQALTTALAEEHAVSLTLHSVPRSPHELESVLHAVARHAAELARAPAAQIVRVVDDGTPLTIVYGQWPDADRTALRAMEEQHPIVVVEPGMPSTVAVPLMDGGRAVGALAVRWPDEPEADRQVGLLRAFADQAVAAIASARLFEELREALDRQTATAEVAHEILGAISAADRTLERVFQSIVGSAVRLCGGVMGALCRYDGTLLHLVATEHYSAEGIAAMRPIYPMRPTRATLTGRAIVERGVVHVPDVEADPEYEVGGVARRTIGFRSFLAVPMLRGDAPIGVISVARREPTPFSAAQIALLRGLADHAVIAIENARLHAETERRRHEAEQLARVARTLTETIEGRDVAQQVVNSVLGLFGAQSAVLRRLAPDGRCPAIAFAGVATGGAAPPDLVPDGTPVARAMAHGRAAWSRDITADWIAAIPAGIDAWFTTSGTRAVLAVPLRARGVSIGVLSIGLKEPHEFTPDEIALLEAFGDQAGISLERARMRDEIVAARDRLERELMAARHVQLAMVPTEFPPPGAPVEICASLQPAREVGGDLYDFFWRDPRTLCFVIADVSDKGAPAALFMARTRTLIRLVVALTARSDDPPADLSEIVGLVNVELSSGNPDTTFVTLVIGMLDVDTGTVCFCNAGHPTPLVLRPDDSIARLSGGTPQPPVGIQAGIQYRAAERSLVPGATIFLYTDGITDATAPDGTRFGDARLANALAGLAGASAEAAVSTAIETVRKFTRTAPQADDIAAVAIRYVPGSRARD